VSKGIRTVLREKYECFNVACRAKPGEYCRTIDNRVTQPHQSRWDQHREFTQKYIQARIAPSAQTAWMSISRLTKAIEPEGWGSGFSQSLAERIITRLKDPAFSSPVADDPGHTHLSLSGTRQVTTVRL